MMKKFLLIVCGSFVGVILALTFFVFATIMFSLAIAGMDSKQSSAAVSEHTVLHLDLSGELTERSTTTSASMQDLALGNMPEKTVGLNVLISALHEASTNDDIEGLFIESNGLSGAPASFFELRKALSEFKSSGKFIYAYANSGYSQGDYYLASVADSMFVNPIGAVELRGLASAIPYFKQLLENVGVEMQVLRVGTFKSAVEPYMLDSISPANRLQTEHYLGQIWGVMRDSIAASRGIEPVALDSIVDNIVATREVDELIAAHLIDASCYRNDFDKKLKSRLGLDEDDDINMVEPSDIALPQEESAGGDHIAVLYAVGEIDDSDEALNDNGIHGEKMVSVINDLTEDDNVKGLVLRVNSPGGSAFASEQIWKAIEDFKAKGKPVAVSMGDYAASGGYYISCGAGRIFAEPTTITGSIGIFGVIPCVQNLSENKLGVKFSVVKTNANSEMGLLTKRLTGVQREALQRMINNGYELFTSRCAQGRGVSQDSIKVNAEGRVWDGITAHKIGLVDELGGVDSAVKWVAEQAKMGDDYDTQNYPAIETDWRMMLNEIMASSAEARLQREMGMFWDYHVMLREALNRDHVLCLMYDRVEL